MALVWCREHWRGRRGGDGDGPIRRYVRAYQAYTNDPKDGPKVVLEAPELPKRLDPYITPNEQDHAALCIGRDPVNDSEHPQLWEILCDFSTSQEEQDQGDNPLLDSAIIAGDADEFVAPVERAYYLEYFGNAIDPPIPAGLRFDRRVYSITNSAGQAFDPPPTIEANRGVLTITKNLDLTVDQLLDLRRQYVKRTNLDWILFHGPGQVKCDSLTWVGDKRGAVKFKRVTGRFSFSEDGFYYEPPNVGYMEVKNGQLLEILDPQGMAYARPQPLNTNGRHVVVTDPDQLIYLRFEIYPSALLIPLFDLLGFQY